MPPIVISCIVFTCVFGGTLAGILLRAALPDHHLTTDSRDVMKLGMGLIATMSALVLSLLVASAKGSYDTQKNELTQMSANVILLDRALAHYGPEAKNAREQLRRVFEGMRDRVWPEDNPQAPKMDSVIAGGEGLYDAVQTLSPQSDVQRSLQAQAVKGLVDLAQTRWLLFEQSGSSIPFPFLVVLVFWLTILFASFGLLAPRNTTVLAMLVLSAASVSGALFLILELDQPFQGLIRISSTPVRNALAQLGR
jgi:hypothetical protein